MNGWLVYKGYLRSKQDMLGVKHYELTESAAKIGLYSESREGPAGVYTVILYSLKAQKYIIGNVNDIMRFQEEQKCIK